MKKDNARATMKGLTRTPEEMVATGTDAIDSLTASPQLAGAGGVKTALALFVTENGNLDAQNKKITKLHQDLTRAEADRVTTVRRWGLRRAGVLHEVNVECDGSKEKVQSFNLPVIVFGTKTQLTTVVPENVHQAKSKKPTTPVVAWNANKRHHGYMVEYATDPANPATYSKPAMVKRARFALVGQTLGAVLHFRVLALDPALPLGQTDYSAWVAVTVGA
jgi:hypothetical protein